MVSRSSGSGFGGSSGGIIGGISSGTGSGRVSRSGGNVPALDQAAASPSLGVTGPPAIGNNAITSSAYGNARPLGFGTMRQAGNIIWALPIDIQEDTVIQSPSGVVEQRTSPGGGGLYSGGRASSGSGTGGTGRTSSVGFPLTGGSSGPVERAISGSVAEEPQSTYSSYATFAVAFGEGIAEDVIRIYMDGQLVFDKTDEKIDIEVPNLVFRFYTGSETQRADPAIVADKGVDNTPAFRGTCYIVFEALNLGIFDDRVPNITAEIVYAKSDQRPVQTSIELPGEPSGLTVRKMAVDWDRGQMYYGVDFDTGGLRRVNLFTGLEDKKVTASEMIASGNRRFNTQDPALGVMGDHGIIASVGNSSNSMPIIRIDPDSMLESHRFGSEGIGLDNLNSRFVNCNRFIPISLRNGSGEEEHFVLCVASFQTELGLLRAEDLEFVWRSNFAPSTNPVGSRIRGCCQGVISDGIGEAWVLSGSTYGSPSAATNQLYRIRVEAGARYDSLQNIVVGVTLSLEATFTVNDLMPGATNLVSTGALVYDWFNDNILILAETLDAPGGFRYTSYDPSTGGIVWTTDTLSTAPGSAAALDANPFHMSRLRNNRLGWVDGTLGRPTLIDTGTGEVLLNQAAPSFSPLPLGGGGGIYDSRSNTYIDALNTGASGEPMVRYLLGRSASTQATLASVITNVVTRTELAAGDIDVTDVASISVPGYLINNQASARQVIENLTGLFLVDSFESDFKIVFRQRGKSSIRTVPEDDLAPLGRRGETETLRQSRIQERELPLKYTITYLDVDGAYIQQSHSAQRIVNPRPTMNSRNNLGTDLPIALTPTVAKQRAEQTLFNAWAERDLYNFRLSWGDIDLDPSDVISLSLNDGTTRRVRLDEIEIGADLSLELDSVSEEGSFISTVAGSGGDRIEQILKTSLGVRTFILDVPYLGNIFNVGTNQFARLHVMQGGYGEDQFTSGFVQRLPADQIWRQFAKTYFGMQWGVAIDALPDPPFDNPHATDFDSTLTIRMLDGASTMAGVTREQLLENEATNRAALLKSNGEVELIRFQNVTENADGSFTLDTFLRGRRGTDTMTNGHGPGEIFILLTTNFGSAPLMPLSERNISFRYRGFGDGQNLSEGDNFQFTSQHRSLKPYAPSNVTAVLDGSNNIDLAWKRRDRLDDGLVNLTGNVPLSEDSEEYEIDILDGPAGAIVRAVTGLTSPSYEYTNANIIADLGSVPTLLTVRVYQISAQVGRGFTKEVTVDVR